jgi:preprotein translocase subunit SecD
MVQIPRWQIILILVVLLGGLVLAFPNLLTRKTADELPSWVPHQQVNLGLDLQGGSYLLLEVDIEGVVREQMENLVDSIRLGLRQAKIGYRDLGVSGEAVVFTLRDPSKSEEAHKIVRGFGNDLLISASDAGEFQVRFTDQALAQRRNSVIEQSIEVVRRRIDETGTREPSIQRQGDRRILIQLPGVRDPERIKALLGKTAKLTFQFLDETVQRPGVDPTPAGTVILPSDDLDANGQPIKYAVKKRVIVSGETLIDAQPTFHDNSPVVAFRFDPVGAKRFGKATQENVGRLFAIVLDNRVISAPRIRTPILDGNGIITGAFTVQETQDLALLLRAGALPAALTILEERTVGPGLGADSVRAGEIACVLGLLFVMVFMALAYGLFGMMANVALVSNLVLILGALSGLQATLTLPGIAGIVLTVGMAVDSNVLIYERMREEQRLGRGPAIAIDAGFSRALVTIIDANLTTILAALILFAFGEGPVKGFAWTLSIGCVTTVFTATIVTQLMIASWFRAARPKILPI